MIQRLREQLHQACESSDENSEKSSWSTLPWLDSEMNEVVALVTSLLMWLQDHES